MATDHYGGPTHRDCLSGRELHRAIHYMNNLKCPTMMPQGPIRALSKGLKEFGWQAKEAHILIDDQGNEMDLTLGSPMMRRSSLIASYDRKRKVEIETLLSKKAYRYLIKV